MLFASRKRSNYMRWISILAYPIAFIKGIMVGRMLNRMKWGRH